MSQVFQCLLETCERRFATAAERKQHLVDAHAFPKSFDFERMHMRSRRGQVRPIVAGATWLQTPCWLPCTFMAEFHVPFLDRAFLHHCGLRTTPPTCQTAHFAVLPPQVRPAEPLQRFTPKPGRSYGRGGGSRAQQAGSRTSQPAGGSAPEQAEADALADDLARKLGGLGRPPQQISFGRSRHHAPLRGRGRGGRRGGRDAARGRGRAAVQLD